VRSNKIISALLVLLTIFLSASSLFAQPKSFGYNVSHFTAGFNYEHWTSPERQSFHNVGINLDLDGLLYNAVKVPGITASYVYEFEFLDKTLTNGGNISMFAGPGATLGWTKDYKTSFGVLAGIKAVVGFEYSSARIPISVGCRVAPVLGLHTYKAGDTYLMSIYKNGLVKALTPELTIKYDIGRQLDGLTFVREEDDSEAEGKFPRVTFGIDLSYNPQSLIYSHFNYTDEDGTRMFLNEARPCFISKATILANVGVNVSRQVNLALYSGYIGIGRYNLVPVQFRTTCFLGKNTGGERMFVYVDGGPGFDIKHQLSKPAIVGSTGVGYRFSLDRLTKLDIGLGLYAYHCSPIIPDSVNTTISTECGAGLRLSTALNF